MIVKQVNIAPSAVYAATLTSQAYGADGATGLRVFINITAVAGVGTWTVKVQIQDPLSGAWQDTGLVSAALNNTNGLTVLTIAPGVTNVANKVLADVCPSSWRVVATLAGTSVTGSLSAELLRD